jgi:hypothetical protein
VKEQEMNFTTMPQAINHRGAFHVLQTICILLAVGSLVTGSVLLSLLWLGDGNVSLFGFITTTAGSEGRSLATVVLLMLTLGSVWLLTTVALLLARQLVAAGLALPTALVVYIGFSLLLEVLTRIVPVPSLVVVGLLVLLNGGALWLAWRFLTSTSRA